MPCLPQEISRHCKPERIETSDGERLTKALPPSSFLLPTLECVHHATARRPPDRTPRPGGIIVTGSEEDLMGLARQLAERVTALRYEDFPPEAVHAGKVAVL